MTAVVIAVTSDQHAGSTVGLCPQRIDLDDGGGYVSSRPQRWLWQNWVAFWAEVKRVRDRERAELYQVFNGDMTDGNHHGTTQILSGNSSVQALVVNRCMALPLKLEPDRMWVIRGTEAHVGKSAEGEEKIADGLRRNKNPIVKDRVTGNSSHWHAKLEVQGVRFDFAHHGRMGFRPWTRTNVTNNLAAEIFYEHSAREEPYPHFAVRSHLHRYADTGSSHPVRVIQTPAWQLHTAFTHRVVTDSFADIGGLIFVVKNGKATLQPVLYKPKSVPTWRASR